MTKSQTIIIWGFLIVLSVLVWSLSYAIIYDIRSYFFYKQFDFSKSFVFIISDDVTASIEHAFVHWPPLSRVPEWSQSFVVQNCLLASAPAIIILAATLIAKAKLQMPSTHGDARLLKFSELNKAGLNKKNGLILGKAGTRTAADDDQSHSIVIGPPASGKTECIVIPNLVKWNGSFIALDFKGTLYERTAKIRQKLGDQVYLIAPGYDTSHTYNPLDLLRRGPQMVTDVQALAGLLVPVNDAKEAHWNQSAQMLLAGLLGYVLESKNCESARTLSSVVDLFSATKNFTKTCEHMIAESEISDWTRARIIEFMAVPVEEAGSIRSTLNRHLLPWHNPAVVALTSSTGHSIPLDQIRKNRMAIYLIIDTGQIDIFAPVLKLFLEQVNSIVNRDFRQKHEHKILFMIDEFYQLGRVKSIVNQLPFARDRDIRIVLVSQGIAQIDEKFGRDGRESIMASCALKIFCSFNDKPTVDLVTHMAGNATQRINTVSRQMPISGGLARKTRNESYAAKPLFRADELYTWPSDKLLVLKTNNNPVVLKKVLADKTAEYIKRSKSAFDIKIDVPMLPIPTVFTPSWGDKRLTALELGVEGEQQLPTQSGDQVSIQGAAPLDKSDELDFDDLWSQCETIVQQADDFTHNVKTSTTLEDASYTVDLLADYASQAEDLKFITR